MRIAAFIFLCFVMFADAATNTPQRIDLPTAINRALAQNRELASRARGVRGAELAAASAKAEFGWRVQPVVAAERSKEEDRIRYGLDLGRKLRSGLDLSGGPSVEHTDSDAGADRETVLRLDARQPLFRNFGALVQAESVIAAERRIQTVRRELEQQKAELVLRVIEQYETLIRLERQIAADEAALARYDRLYRLTRARERQGRATRVDTLRVDLRRGEATARLEANRERLSSLRRDFAELLGEDPDRVYELEPPPLFEITPAPDEQAVATALSNRLDYAQVLQEYADAQRGQRIARRSLLPDIVLIGRAESRATEDGDNSETWSIGISGNTDLNRTRDLAQVEQAAISLERARDAVRIRELAIVREVQQSASAYRQARLDVDIAERNYIVAEQRARLTRRLFELRRADNQSVTDAEDELAAAETRRYAARAEASIAGYRYLHALGLLVESPPDLRPRLEEGLP